MLRYLLQPASSWVCSRQEADCLLSPGIRIYLLVGHRLCGWLYILTMWLSKALSHALLLTHQQTMRWRDD
jgi:hypothetical protein